MWCSYTYSGDSGSDGDQAAVVDAAQRLVEGSVVIPLIHDAGKESALPRADERISLSVPRGTDVVLAGIIARIEPIHLCHRGYHIGFSL